MRTNVKTKLRMFNEFLKERCQITILKSFPIQTSTSKDILIKVSFA